MFDMSNVDTPYLYIYFVMSQTFMTMYINATYATSDNGRIYFTPPKPHVPSVTSMLVRATSNIKDGTYNSAYSRLSLRNSLPNPNCSNIRMIIISTVPMTRLY